MGTPGKPEQVKLFLGVLHVGEKVRQQAESEICGRFGPIDCRTDSRRFSHTRYYEKEMGHVIYRCFFSFQTLINPEELPAVKLFTNSLEDRYRSEIPPAGRTINLDPGYMNHGSVILATTKNYSHRVYLNSGIYAELTLRNLGKQWSPLEWTYPDYRVGETLKFFQDVRVIYLRQRRKILDKS